MTWRQQLAKFLVVIAGGACLMACGLWLLFHCEAFWARIVVAIGVAVALVAFVVYMYINELGEAFFAWWFSNPRAKGK